MIQIEDKLSDLDLHNNYTNNAFSPNQHLSTYVLSNSLLEQ